jgi:hypothetical protein
MPKIGDGDIGSILPESDLLFFASGVSNSQCTDESEYQRELSLLLDQPRDSHIVYFSSIGVFDQDSRYYRHKRDMELTIKINFPNYCIIRLGNISWGDNPNTLINYLKSHPKAEIQDVYRHVIDKDEFLYWITRIPDFSCEMMLPGRKLKVKEIVEQYVRV